MKLIGVCTYCIKYIICFVSSVAWENMNTQILQKIKGILEFDVNQPSHYDEVLKNAPYDVITSTFCLAGANFTVQDFTKALYNIRYYKVKKSRLMFTTFYSFTLITCPRF